MSRTALLKTGYVLALAACGGLAWLLVNQLAHATGLFVAIVLLLPARVQGHYWRDFFRGRRLFDRMQYADAVQHFDHFLEQLKERPWVRHLIWLAWPGYSVDATAMTLTNLGAARLHMGQLEEAETALRAALVHDARTPLPWYNLGLLHSLRHEAELAAEALRHARQLGFSGGLSDRLIMRVASGLAQLEGVGRSARVTAN